MKKIIADNPRKQYFFGGCLLIVMLLLSMSGNCLAAQFVKIRLFPEHVGVFTTVREQQFVAFGYKADGTKVNITKRVDWKSSNKAIVTINANGLATVVAGKKSGQVKISCSFPKTKPRKPSLLGPYLLLLNDLPSFDKTPIAFLKSIYLLLLKKQLN